MTAGRANRLALQEAYRPLTVREGDEVRTLPTIQAVMRQQARSAAKGNGPAQRHLIDRVQAIEQEALSPTHSGDAENPLLGPVTDADRIKALVSLLRDNPEALATLLSDPAVKQLLK